MESDDDDGDNGNTLLGQRDESESEDELSDGEMALAMSGGGT